MDRSGWTGPARAIARIGIVVAFLSGASAQSVLADVLRVPQDFGTIQAAVDAASPGDVIRVSPGTYPERVTISTSAIRLEADPLHAAILDGASFTDDRAAISVQGTSATPIERVSIVGFTIENYRGTGISLAYADRCALLSNRVSNTRAQSIALIRSTYNRVADNTLSNGTIGVGMSSRSTDNTVKENTIAGSFVHGIRVSMVQQTPQPPLRNTIKENVICVVDPASSETGVLIAGFASGNTIKENRIVGNGVSTVGIKLEASTSGNLVKENILNGHTVNVEYLPGNTVAENVWDPTLRCR
jgi:parallel beta-helix repeat protein